MELFELKKHKDWGPFPSQNKKDEKTTKATATKARPEKPPKFRRAIPARQYKETFKKSRVFGKRSKPDFPDFID